MPPCSGDCLVLVISHPAHSDLFPAGLQVPAGYAVQLMLHSITVFSSFWGPLTPMLCTMVYERQQSCKVTICPEGTDLLGELQLGMGDVRAS